MHFYFAYGSNMNSERVVERGLEFTEVFSATMNGVALRFNKRAIKDPKMVYANVVYAPNSCVEGVVYRLSDAGQITKMDYFEGSPVRYSREKFWLKKPDGSTLSAWVYIANKAMLADGLKPASWYLDHLLKGKQYLSKEYFDALAQTPTC
ncbi:MAG: gamma-glutamylcyclotransferase [Pseudomonadales bacterium]|nr:gamma-glutamylcyclotransferase [Pseudomonadales bacterium]